LSKITCKSQPGKCTKRYLKFEAVKAPSVKITVFGMRSIFMTLKMEAGGSSEVLVNVDQITRDRIPEDYNFSNIPDFVS
jgi:hypothetical protein